MKLQELRNLINEEIRKVLKEGSLRIVSRRKGPFGDQMIFEDEQYHYHLAPDRLGQYRFIVYLPYKSRPVAEFDVKKDINKIKSSPYYEAYQEAMEQLGQGL